MTKVWEKLGGTSETTFQIGLGGPKVKNASGVLEARNAADDAYAVIRGADPSGANDLVTKGYTGSISATAADSALFAGKSDTWFVYGGANNATNQAASVENLLELAHYKSGHWDASDAAWLPDLGWWWGLTTAHRSNGPAYNFGGQITFQNGGGGDNVYARTIAGGPTPTATAWSKLLSSGNYNSYAPTLTGTGASGTWGINVTGSAGSAVYADAVTVVDDVATNATMYPVWVDGTSGAQGAQVSSSLLQFNPGAQILGYGGRQFQLSNSESTYRWKFGGSTATGWYKIADITIGLGLYSGASFEIDFLEAMGNFGNSALSEPYRFYVSCTRSAAVQDDMDYAVVSGPKTEYLRVVKTATGVFELQVAQPYDWRTHEVTCHCMVRNVAVVTYANSPGAGSAPGTAYTATAQHYHRLTNLEVTGAYALFGTTQGYSYFYEDTLNFHLNTNANATGWINYEGYAGGTSQFRDLTIGDGKQNAIAFFDGSTGNFGVGTTAPGGALDIARATVSGTSDLLLKYTWSNDTANWGMRFYQRHTGSVIAYDWKIRNAAAPDIDVLTFLPEGHVGIGTTTPAYTLDVNGDINIAEGQYYRYGAGILAYAQTALHSYYFGSAGNLTSTGAYNLAIGPDCGTALTTGSSNVFAGSGAGQYNTTGTENTCVGAYTGFNSSTGSYNVFIGSSSGMGGDQAYASSDYNTAIGYGVCFWIGTSAIGNTSLGASAGYNFSTGTYNVFVGMEAGYGYGSEPYTGADYNVCVGYRSGYRLTNGSDNNTLVGAYAGDHLTTGDGNVLLGYYAGSAITTESNLLYVANSSSGAGSTLLTGDFATGSIGIGMAPASITARLHLPAGTATASTAPLKFMDGVLLGTAEEGAFEFDVSTMWMTPKGTQRESILGCVFSQYETVRIGTMS